MDVTFLLYLKGRQTAAFFSSGLLVYQKTDHPWNKVSKLHILFVYNIRVFYFTQNKNFWRKYWSRYAWYYCSTVARSQQGFPANMRKKNWKIFKIPQKLFLPHSEICAQNIMILRRSLPKNLCGRFSAAFGKNWRPYGPHFFSATNFFTRPVLSYFSEF